MQGDKVLWSRNCDKYYWSFCDLMRDTAFPNTMDSNGENSFLGVANNCQQSQGQWPDFDGFLISTVSSTRLWMYSSKMMAPKRLFRRRSWQSIFPMKNITKNLGHILGAQSSNCHMMTAVHSPTKRETMVIGKVLTALNDLKSDMGTVKKIRTICTVCRHSATAYIWCSSQWLSRPDCRPQGKCVGREVFALFLEKSAACLCWKQDRTIGTQFHAYQRANADTGRP